MLSWDPLQKVIISESVRQRQINGQAEIKQPIIEEQIQATHISCHIKKNIIQMVGIAMLEKKYFFKLIFI